MEQERSDPCTAQRITALVKKCETPRVTSSGQCCNELRALDDALCFCRDPFLSLPRLELTALVPALAASPTRCGVNVRVGERCEPVILGVQAPGAEAAAGAAEGVTLAELLPFTAPSSLPPLPTSPTVSPATASPNSPPSPGPTEERTLAQVAASAPGAPEPMLEPAPAPAAAPAAAPAPAPAPSPALAPGPEPAPAPETEAGAPEPSPSPAESSDACDPTALVGLVQAGTAAYCSPRHPIQFESSPLELTGIT